MPRRLSKAEFFSRHSAIISLAQKKHTLQEIALKTGKSEKMVSFTITTARQRGIKIPYKTKQKRNVSDARQEFKQRLIDLLGETHRPFNYRKVLQMFAQGASVEVVASEVASQLNIPNKKAHNIAQTIYYLRKMK